MNRQPTVVAYPTAVRKLKQGFDIITDLLALTLGPSQGIVVSSTDLKPRPEVLTDAATIARRVTELPDPEQNMGAMLLRNLVWRMRERVGDGSATAAVLAKAILHQGVRSITAGANPMGVMDGIRSATTASVKRLVEMSCPVESEDDLVAIARAVTGHEDLSWVLGEMFHILGPRAYITVEEYVAPYLERVYLDGGRWQGNNVSPYLVTAHTLGRAVQADCRVALYDGNISSADELRPLLLLAGQMPSKRLLLVAHRIHDEALNLLTGTHQQTELKIVAANLKRAGVKAQTDLQDLALLTGAALISPAMGRRLSGITEKDLGRAARAEAGVDELLVSGGGGNPAEIRRQIELIQHQIQALPLGDENKPELEMRLGRLSGSAGVLKIGAISQAERDFLKQTAEQGVKALRATLEEGLLPGGCTAYLHCIQAAKEVASQLEGDASAGARAVAAGLEAPFRQILANAGIKPPGTYLAAILDTPPGLVYDVQNRRLCDARQAGILDSTQTLRAALETAASGAMMALSTDTLVVKRKPKISYEP